MTAATYQDKPWLNQYEKEVPPELTFEDTFLPQFFERTAADYPRRTALIFMGYKMSYQDLKDKVDRFATALSDLGVQKGDRVSLVLPNVIPFVISYLAIQKIGAAPVLNNPLYTDRELAHQLNDSGSVVLITLDLLGNRMIDLRPQTPVKHIVATSIGDYLPFPKSLLFKIFGKKKKLAADVAKAKDVYKFKDLIKNTAPNPPHVELSPDDMAMLPYTGGTTGVSKGVVITHRNMSRQVQQLKAWFPQFKIGDKEVILGALPFFHSFGVMCSMSLAFTAGWTNVLVPKPQPDQLLEAIEKHKPTFVPLVPTMFIGLLSHPNIDKVDLSCIKGCFSGSAPLPIEVIKDFEARTGAAICEGYGMTETSPCTHTNPYVGTRKPGSIGLPICDTECRIVDLEEGVKDMPVGQPGEIIMRGPQVMAGYYNRPDATAATIRDGWIYTGDIGKMDEDGFFYIVDRKKDMIISGGYNVYPRDIDEVFYEHPKVEEACSIGVPHPKRGEQIKVFVVLRRGQTATEQEMIDYCRSKLAVYKLPTMIEFRDELPKSAVGKILRKELRSEELEKTAN